MNLTPTVDQFRDAMKKICLEPPATIQADGALHRFTSGEDKAANSWYILHDDGDLPAGAFGCWKRNLSETWAAKEYKGLTLEEKAAYTARMDAMKRQREQELQARRAECITKATSMLKSAKEPDLDHAYLVKKGIKPFGAKQLNDLLLIPLRKNKSLVGLQTIAPDGTKRFLTGTEKNGAYLAIAGTGDTVYLCEGWATGCTIHEATGCTVIVCFDCGNIAVVAKEIRAKGPEYNMVLCADNDLLTEGNPGLTKATAAALEFGGLLAVPAMPEGIAGTDWNDLHQAAGIEEVKRQLLLAKPVEYEAVRAVSSEQARDEYALESKNPLIAAVERLAALSPLEYDQVRVEEAKSLGVRPATLDSAIKNHRKDQEQKTDTPFHEVEPADDPVDGSELLDDILHTVKRFIVCEHHTAVAATLWIVAAWFADVVRVAPLALITAPEKRCGKSTLLELIGRLTPKPLTASSITPSALFRSIDLWKPTLLIDEVDATLKDNEELRGLINSGHTRSSAYTIRCTGDDHKPTMFSTWSFKALSGIGNIADTLMDRSIILELRRKLPDETIERMHHAPEGYFQDLCSRLARFTEDNAGDVKASRPPLPDQLNDRARDNWEPLLQVAMTAGDKWLHNGIATAEHLAGVETGSVTVGSELLADIQSILKEKGLDRISTTDLITALISDDEKPWLTYNRGFQIKPRQLATKLKGYGIHSKTIRINNTTHKGYELEQFKDVFSRYLPSTPLSKSNTVTSKQYQEVSAFSKGNTDASVTYLKQPNNAESLGCYLVTDRIPPMESNEVFDLTDTDFEVVP